jgi:hypothetical protein
MCCHSFTMQPATALPQLTHAASAAVLLQQHAGVILQMRDDA